MIKTIFFVVLAVAAGLHGGAAPVANAADKIKFYQYANSYGAEGYDVVSYFGDDARPLPGSQQYKAVYGGETWLFSSAANRDKFIAAPARYIPQYGGHCAYGVAQGYLVRGDPLAWSVHDDTLYLNYNQGIRREWNSKKTSYLRRSEKNWPQLNN